MSGSRGLRGGFKVVTAGVGGLDKKGGHQKMTIIKNRSWRHQGMNQTTHSEVYLGLFKWRNLGQMESREQALKSCSRD